MATMPKGTVKTFEAENGFGLIVLESGEEVPFDISVSNKREIEIGATADVTLGIGYTGKARAKLVVFEVEADRAPSFTAGFKHLLKLGFFATWNVAQAKIAARELLCDLPPKLLRQDLGALFQSYYGEGLSDRGRGEGVIVLDWRHGSVSPTPAEDLLALSKGQARVEVRNESDRTFVDGHEIDLTQGLEPLLALMNANLSVLNEDGRFYSFDFDGDFYVIVYRTRAFANEIRKLSFLRLT